MSATLPRWVPASRRPLITRLAAVAAGLALLAGAAALYRTAQPSRTASLEHLVPRTAAQQAAQESCLHGSLLMHDVRWAAACMAHAEQDKARHAACLADPAITGNPQLGRAYCDSNFGQSDGSAECELPEERSATLYALLQQSDRGCMGAAVAGAEQ
jgi:hypothetical protein